MRLNNASLTNCVDHVVARRTVTVEERSRLLWKGELGVYQQVISLNSVQLRLELRRGSREIVASAVDNADFADNVNVTHEIDIDEFAEDYWNRPATAVLTPGQYVIDMIAKLGGDCQAQTYVMEPKLTYLKVRDSD